MLLTRSYRSVHLAVVVSRVCEDFLCQACVTVAMFLIVKGAVSPHTHARANENKLEKVDPSFSSSVGDFGRLFLSV